MNGKRAAAFERALSELTLFAECARGAVRAPENKREEEGGGEFGATERERGQKNSGKKYEKSF